MFSQSQWMRINIGGAVVAEMNLYTRDALGMEIA